MEWNGMGATNDGKCSGHCTMETEVIPALFVFCSLKIKSKRARCGRRAYYMSFLYDYERGTKQSSAVVYEYE